MTPESPTPDLEPPADQFTLEEWVAATQACCGVDHTDELPDTASDS